MAVIVQRVCIREKKEGYFNNLFLLYKKVFRVFSATAAIFYLKPLRYKALRGCTKNKLLPPFVIDPCFMEKKPPKGCRGCTKVAVTRI